MLKYLQTTTLILSWTFLLSLAWGWITYEFASRRKILRPPKTSAYLSLVPTLVLAPILILAAYRLWGWNLIFPVHLTATFSDLVKSAFVPGVVLLLACGLPTLIWRQIHSELHYWREKPFVLYAEANGLTAARVLRRLVLCKAMLHAWLICMPWLFGELVILEALFNAPGLALDAWHQARTRDMLALANVLSSLALIYGMCLLFAVLSNRWLGLKLESYQ